ncbi:hypothetical protein RhiirA4_548295 [Rhizophagus irregularis]|uniref:MIR domain-containing protein n=1 Tax=Rhizophagus irregularis TaxID=588596 RepID=A0A2I1H709_9GLOM|nr:hypothetical protein RhiirA4_548295 [Rhizophagus irregularis]
MIHPSINVSKANTFEEISNTLKNDILFILFKQSVKKKLQKLEFDPKNKNYVQFINIFREYCYEAEINVEEQKKLLLEKLSEDSFQYYFINNNLEKIKSLNDLIIYFNQGFLEQQKLIRYGSCITLKHVATGKYLTSCYVNYKTGSKEKIVFASKALSKSNSLWIVSCDQNNNGNPIIYGKSEVYLKKNKGILEYLVISNNYKSPSTGNWEVSVSIDSIFNKHLIESDSTNNNDTYIKSKEIVYIRDVNDNFVLRSHEFPFTIENETYQEIVGHKGRVDENDKWCIELFENE